MADRVCVLYAADTDAAEELRMMLDALVDPPLHPVPADENPRTYEQQPFSPDEVDALVLAAARRIAGRIEWGGMMPGPTP